MTEEEYFRKHYPDVCYNGKPLSPYWDLFQDGVEFSERQSEKKIKELEQKLEQTEKDLADYQFNYPTIKELTEGTCFAHLKSLEKENAELKADNDARKFAMAMSEKVEKQLREYLTKAKEIIREIMKFDIPTLDYEKAEQFLKEIEK